MAIIGYGTTLSLDPGTGTFAVRAGTTNISIPKSSVNMVDANDLNVASRIKVRVPGLIDGGQFTFELFYTRAVMDLLKSVEGKNLVGTAKVKWRITLPDDDGAGADVAQTFTVEGTLMSVEYDAKVEEILIIKCEVQTSGVVTIA